MVFTVSDVVFATTLDAVDDATNEVDSCGNDGATGVEAKETSLFATGVGAENVGWIGSAGPNQTGVGAAIRVAQ